jgi:hypothetical protein
MPASICGAIGTRPTAYAFTVSVVLRSFSANVTAVSFEQMIAVVVSRYVAEDEALGRNDLPKLIFHRIVPAVGPAHHDAQLTSDSHVKLADRIGKTTRTEPLRHRFRIGPRFPYQRARRIEHPRDGDSPLSELGGLVHRLTQH